MREILRVSNRRRTINVSYSEAMCSFVHQKEQLEVKESRGNRGSSGMTEDEVFSKVASLFKGQEDLLAEFGQFLPDAKRSLVSKKNNESTRNQMV